MTVVSRQCSCYCCFTEIIVTNVRLLHLWLFHRLFHLLFHQVLLETTPSKSHTCMSNLHHCTNPLSIKPLKFPILYHQYFIKFYFRVIYLYINLHIHYKYPSKYVIYSLLIHIAIKTESRDIFNFNHQWQHTMSICVQIPENLMLCLNIS